MCKESDAFGPIIHFPCSSDKQCENIHGPGCKCIRTFCCPPLLFDKTQSQASLE
ncbi:hypothetical protein Lalb_Chr21g0306001 [Lupinus albus]|uniref:Uncharacterized protein n=1 Tax=Lupinus albus TaxID=3870 RepID=A0A6A4NJW8_LUPAL|nr:hypothetical protein Lalb_Chr21g0306001 [Lupinus albus]